VSTLGEIPLGHVDPETHRPIYGLTHGTLLYLVLCWYLGNASQHPVAGIVGGALVGRLAPGERNSGCGFAERLDVVAPLE
jgi:hypothetical protein